tara:strand:- start:62 stop:544 length:483 start_codon:yes stop_codon:yes gene_type:complete
MPSSHCKKCHQEQSDSCSNPCDPKSKKGHVYVIELKSEVLEERDFAPDFCRKKYEPKVTKCLYVGQSKHQPYCRYKQHIAKRSRPRTAFVCKCSGKNKKILFHFSNKGNKHTKKYYKKGAILGELFKHLNPVIGDTQYRRKVEKELAQDLRAKGHAVHSN